MSPLKTSAPDATYRNIWNECIREEFVDDGFGCILESVSGSSSSHVHDVVHPSCACTPPCQRGECRESVSLGSISSGYASSSVPSFALFAGYAFNPSIPYPTCHAPIFRGKVQPSLSPTISVAELGDFLFARNIPYPKNNASLPGSSCSSPASSDISLPSASRRRAAHPGASSSEEELEEGRDSGDESSNSEDEYRPTRVMRTRSNAFKHPSFASEKAAVARACSSRTQNSGSHPTIRQPSQKYLKRATGHNKIPSQRSKPRAKQVDASVPFVIPDDFRCLHCDFEQTNHRLQDFKRHVANHFRSTIYWECCGVPVSEAAAYGIGRHGKVLERDGAMLVGGCGGDFGRKDAYKRHLDDPNNSCVGDIDADWHPGNAYKDFD